MLTEKLTRRAFLRGSAIAFAGTLLAACTKPTPTPTPKPEPTKAAATAAPTAVPATKAPTPVPPTATPSGPKIGGSVVMPIGTDIPMLDPCDPGYMSMIRLVGSLAYDPWFINDRNVKRVGYVVKSATRPSPDKIVIEIKPGIKFHGSGREFQAADAVWCHERFTNKELACWDGDTARDKIASVKATGTYTFEITPVDPKLLTERITEALPPIVDRKAVESNPKGNLLLQAEAGTGPWVLDKWVTDSFISFKRNPNSWDKAPLLDEFRFVIMPETRAQVAAMKAGDVNYMTGNADVAAQFKGDNNVTVTPYFGGDYMRINVNCNRPGTKDVNVRLAINHGINRKQLIDTMTMGEGVISGPVALAAQNAVIPKAELEGLLKFDPELAKSYMAKAGYNLKDKRLKLILLGIGGYDEWNRAALVIQANLKDIGIDAEIRIPEVAVWADARIKTFDYDLSMNGYGSDLVDPDLTCWRTGQFEEQWTGGSNPDFDKLVDAWLIEPDQAKRDKLVQDAQRQLLKNAREIFLYSAPSYAIASKKLIGLEVWPGNPGTLRAFDWEQVHI